MVDICLIPGASEPCVLPGAGAGHYSGICFVDYIERPWITDVLSLTPSSPPVSVRV